MPNAEGASPACDARSSVAAAAAAAAAAFSARTEEDWRSFMGARRKWRKAISYDCISRAGAPAAALVIRLR